MPMVPKKMRKKAKIVNVRTLDSDQSLTCPSDEAANATSRSDLDCKPRAGLDLESASNPSPVEPAEQSPVLTAAKCSLDEA